MIRSIKRIQYLHLKDRRVQHEITINENDLVRKYDEQFGLCHWSKIPMDVKNNSIPNHPLAISVDRIDPALGYTYDNTLLVLRLFNLGRNRYSFDDFPNIVQKLKESLNA